MTFFDKDDFRGVASSRVRQPYKLFEACLDELLGERVRADGACAVDLWCAIASVGWRSPEGLEVRYSYRQACDVVAWVREEVDGFQYYCSGEPGIVADWIAQGLKQAGWSPVSAKPVGRSDTSPATGDESSATASFHSNGSSAEHVSRNNADVRAGIVVDQKGGHLS